MFEKFSVPKLYIETQSLLALYASGRTTGLVVDVGYDMTHTVPVFEGSFHPVQVLGHAVGGIHMTIALEKKIGPVLVNPKTFAVI